jgi:protease-4
MKSFFKNVLSTTIGMLLSGLITLIVIGMFLTAAVKMSQYGGLKSIEKNSILELRLNGDLVEKHRPLDFDFFGNRSIFREERTLGLYEINKAIDFAKDDARFSGIYLNLVDLNAGWASLSALRRHLIEFQQSGKWVYCYSERYNAKSYYLATAAKTIFMQPNGDIEFNGLAVNEPFFKGLLEKLEIEPRVFRVGRFKAAVEPFILDRMSDENRKQNQELLGDIWAEVRKAAAQKAKVEESKIDELATNLKVLSASDAKDNGMVDELVYEDDMENRMAKDTVGPDDDLPFVSAGQLLRDHHNVKAIVNHNRSGKKIALIFAEGEIKSGVADRDGIGSQSLREDILDASRDEDVQAIVVRVNSPGGDALASDVIWRELMVQDEDIPVVVSMGDVAASGGYYMSAAARYIFAEPTTITGSIGVFGLMFGTEKLFKDKAGVQFDRVVTHPHADIGDTNRPMTEIEGQSVQREVERVYKRFIDVVAEGRGYEQRSDLEAIAEGRVWSGTKAKELGLVDELGGLDQALEKASEFAGLGTDYDVEVFPKDSDPIMQLLDKFSGDTIETLISQNAELLHMRALLKAFPAFNQIKQMPLKSGVYARMMTDIDIH